jgi:hypothetical protein
LGRIDVKHLKIMLRPWILRKYKVLNLFTDTGNISAMAMALQYKDYGNRNMAGVKRVTTLQAEQIGE